MKSSWMTVIAVCTCMACGAEPSGADDESPLETVTSPLTSTQRLTAIVNKRAQPESAFLGSPVGDYVDYGDGGGQKYQNGYIYIGDSVGRAHLLYGLIRSKWVKLGREGFLGYPTTDELSTSESDGRFNYFERGSIYWKNGASAAFEVHGCALKVWGLLSHEQSKLGFPTSDRYGSTWHNAAGNEHFDINAFEAGKLYINASRGTTCATQVWPVLSGPISNRGAQYQRVFVNVSYSVADVFDRRHIYTSGSGLTPNTSFTVYLNTPSGQSSLASGVSSSTGTFSSGSDWLEGDLKGTNGYATIQVVDATNRMGVTLSAGPSGFYTGYPYQNWTTP